MRRNSVMIQIIAFTVLLVGAVPAAFATNYGRWFCGTCNVAGDYSSGGGTALLLDSDVISFIRSNPGITGMWNQNDTIVVCDGKSCVPIVFPIYRLASPWPTVQGQWVSIQERP